YDREKDPQEMRNVYNDPAYAETVVQLREQLKALRIKYKDSHDLDQKFINKTYKGIAN
ncbi:MAG: sulfatase/phosphatase domain-containing protein, partial [Algibacter sp.]